MSPDRKFISLLASTVAVTPMAIDLYLPAIPVIAEQFSSSNARIAITVSLYMLGLVIGQLLAGPLSDKYGRKPIIMSGLCIFSIASIGLAITFNWQSFWALRLLQAISGGIAVVGVPALVRDRANGNEAAKMLAGIAFIMVFAPAAAPALGSLILFFAHWRWLFIFLAMYSCCVCLAIWKVLPPPQPITQSTEVRKKSQPAQAASSGYGFHTYAYVLKNYSAMGYMLAQGTAFGVMLTFVVNASYLYQSIFQLSNIQFSILFALNICFMGIINRINAFLLNRYPVERLARYGIGIQVLGVLTFCTTVAIEAPLYFMVPCIMLIVGAQGMLMPNTTASALKAFPRHAGVASATLGSMRYLFGALISGISTLFQTGNLHGMALVMLTGSILSISGLILASVMEARGQSQLSKVNI